MSSDEHRIDVEGRHGVTIAGNCAVNSTNHAAFKIKEEKLFPGKRFRRPFFITVQRGLV
jgi:hypothetical protein